MVGPFVFFDHFGPVEYAPGEGFDVRPHPHIGLSTVTYLFEGAIEHRDSLGTDLVIRPGAVNWMTAGHGIVHSERTPASEREAGQNMHGLQTWVALPKTHEDVPPAFDHHPADTLPEFNHQGARMRVLAGEAFGKVSPVHFPWPILYVAFETDEGANLILPHTLAEERAVYLAIRLEPGTKGVICGGAAMDGPRKIEWNFVASDPALIDQAKQDWQNSVSSGGSDRFPTVPGDEEEWIPLP
jgi:redox-sensitive bicupin YhaK (pirin superfamily)